MMKRQSALVVFLFLCMWAKSQQLPIYSQYMINDYITNPAIGGKEDLFEAKASSRYQWVGITDAPRTYILSLNGPIRRKNVGVGGYLFTDITGPIRRIGIYGSYAYHLKLGEEIRLSLGLSGGLLQYTIDGTKIKLHDPSADPALNGTLQSKILPDFGFGAYFYNTEHTYYAGVSAPQLLQNKIDLFSSPATSLNKLTTHIYVTGGYKYQINDDFAVEPSTLLKLSQVSLVQIDLGARAIYQKQVWLGGYFRTKDAASVILGYIFKDYLTIGYSFDFTTSEIRKYSSGTHEIMLGMKF